MNHVFQAYTWVYNVAPLQGEKVYAILLGQFIHSNTSAMANSADDTPEWADIPLFAPPGSQIPNLSTASEDEAPSAALSALSHLLYDKESPQEESELLRNQGNQYFKRSDKR